MLRVESKKAILTGTESRMVVTRGWGQWEDVGQIVEISSSKNEFWGSNVQHGDDS